MKISNQELIELSTKIEREGKTFYKELANHVPDPEVKDFLLLMSREEAQHEIEFKKMLDAKGQKHYGWEENKSLRQLVNTYYQTDIFPRLDEIFDQVPKFKGIQKALDFALESEKVSAEFYSLLQQSCNNLETKTLLVLLEKAEHEHLERVEALRIKYQNG